MEYEQVIETPRASRGSLGNEAAPLLASRGGLKPPPDRRKIVFFIFGFLGLASLLPWNFFITAKKYFDYKLRNISLPANVSFDDKDHLTNLQKEFESYLSIVSNGSNLVFMVITMALVRKVSVKVRIVVSTTIMTGIFIVTTSLVEIDTDPWQDVFFYVTLIMAAFMSGVQSVLTGSVLGLSALFPAIYSQSAMIGQAAGGTFSAVVSILTHSSGGESPITSALIYFLTAAVVTALSLMSYIMLHYLKYSKFFMQVNNNELLQSSVNEEKSYTHLLGKDFFITIFKKTWMYCASLCLVFLVTLSIFPAVCSLIKSVNEDKNVWTETYFTPVVCFLFFNIGDFVGRLSTFVFKYPGPGRPGTMLILCVLRLGFVPLLMLCNAQPRVHLSLVFDNDAYPMVFILLMGLTNGYLSTLCMSFGPIDVLDEHAEGAGMMLALSMTLGLAAGSGFSFLCVTLL